MPKIKTPKSVKKRLRRITGSKRVALRTQSSQHRARFKSKRALKRSRRSQIAPSAFAKKVKRLISV